MSASIYFGADCIAQGVEVHPSIHGVRRAIASLVTRTEYRRAYRGCSPQQTSAHIRSSGAGFLAWVETRNDDGTRGPTYTVIGESE